MTKPETSLARRIDDAVFAAMSKDGHRDSVEQCEAAALDALADAIEEGGPAADDITAALWTISMTEKDPGWLFVAGLRRAAQIVREGR